MSTPRQGRRMTRVAVLGTGSWGTAFSMVLADAGADVVLWGRRQELADAITATHENPDYLPGIPLPETVAATSDAAEAARAAPRSWSSPCRPRRCAATSAPGRRPAARLRPGQPDEGHRARHHQADERGHRRGDRRRPGADRGRVRARTWPGRSPQRQPAASVVACADEAVAEKLQQVCLDGVLPAVHQHRRGRRRARRRGEERHRAGRRHRQGHGHGRQLAGVDHHPRPRRDHPAGTGAGRRRRHLRRPRRCGRPRRDLHLAAVAQPHLRREPRPGHDRRRDGRGRPSRPPRA